MSRFALFGKEVYELALERRLLLTLLLVSGIFSLGVGFMLDQPLRHPSSPMEFLGVIQHGGPIIVGLLAVVLAGDAVARERQDRTLHLLFTAPASRTQYWTALLAAHAVAFAVLAALLLLFSALVGAAMGWVAVKGTSLLLVLALLPLFLTLDMLVLACSARLSSGRASLLVALVMVLLLWSTSALGPFGWALQNMPAWSVASAWHPFDLAGTSAASLLERGTLAWTPLLKALAEAVLAGGAAWASIATREAGR